MALEPSSNMLVYGGYSSKTRETTLRAVASRKFKRVFLPLHRTLKRFIILSGFGVLFFVFYVQLVDIYVQKLRRTQGISPFDNGVHTKDFVEKANHSIEYYEFNKIHIAPEESALPSHFLILTCSSPWDVDHLTRRSVIRKTWANCEKLSKKFAKHPESFPYKFCRLIFFTGRTFSKELDNEMANEVSQFGDVLIVDVYDSYRNITFKLMSAMKWASTQRFKFLLKTDDDVYVHLPNLYYWLEEEKVTLPKNLYGGVTYNGIVVRDPTSKHYVSRTDYSPDRYPLYCKGSLYLLSGHLIPRLVHAARSVKPFNIDDAYIGILLNKLKVAPTALTRFIQFKFMYLTLDLMHYCDLTWVIGIGDSLKPKQVINLHHRFLELSASEIWMCYNVNPFVFMLGLIVSSISLVFLVLKNQTEQQ